MKFTSILTWLAIAVLTAIVYDNARYPGEKSMFNIFTPRRLVMGRSDKTKKG